MRSTTLLILGTFLAGALLVYYAEAAKSQLTTGSYACDNWFEKDADLSKGGYPC